MLTKKHLFLMCILSSLVVFTYFFEEKGKTLKENSRIERKSLIKKLDDINFISLPNISFKRDKTNTKWRVISDNRDISNLVFNEFLLIISSLRVESIIEQPEDIESYFKLQDKTLIVERDDKKVNYRFGDVSQLTGHFYVLSNGVLYICSDRSSLDSPYRSELDLKLRKFLRLKKYLEASVIDFIDKRFFTPKHFLTTTKLVVDGVRNRWFEIDLVKNMTRPAPYKGVSVKENLKIETHKLLKMFQYQRRLKFSKDFVSTSSGSLELFSVENSKSTFHLYNTYNGRFGRYIHEVGSPYIYELIGIKTNLFYLNVQSFWDKTFIHNVDLNTLDQFIFDVSLENDKFFQFIVNDVRNKFTISSLEESVEFDKTKMNFLFNLLFNLIDFKEADYIEENIILSQEHSSIRVKLFNKIYGISKNKNLITVVDHSLRIKFFFNYSSQELGETFFETIFTVGKK